MRDKLVGMLVLTLLIATVLPNTVVCHDIGWPHFEKPFYVCHDDLQDIRPLSGKNLGFYGPGCRTARQAWKGGQAAG